MRESCVATQPDSLPPSPFNPGLLFARAFAEVIHPEGDLQDFTANLEASLTSARDRYSVSATELDGFVGDLLDSLESNSFDGLSLALDVASRLGLASEEVTRIEDEAMNARAPTRVYA